MDAEVTGKEDIDNKDLIRDNLIYKLVQFYHMNKNMSWGPSFIKYFDNFIYSYYLFSLLI